MPPLPMMILQPERSSQRSSHFAKRKEAVAVTAKALPCSVPSGLRSKKQPISFSSSAIRSMALVASVQARSLVAQPFAALDDVYEMALDRVVRLERDVVAALHHLGAAAFAEQALGGNGDIQRRIARVGMQRRKQAGAARAEDQHVGPEPFYLHAVL